MEKNSQTQFIENVSKEGGFTSAKNVAGEKDADTDSGSGGVSTSSEDKYGLRHVPRVVEMLEDRFAFTAVLFSIIGYIAVASFGHLENFGSYLRYLIFLTMMFILYKFLHLQRIELKQAEKINKLTLIVLIILALFIAIEHFSKFTAAFFAFIR